MDTFITVASWYALQIQKIFVNLNSHFVGQCILFLFGFGMVSGMFVAMWRKDNK